MDPSNPKDTSAPDLPLHEHLRAHARRQPDKPAYLWYGRAISYAELDAASDAFAARLAALGVGAGDPVALFMANCPQYAMAHFGIQKLGAVVCPCGPLNKEHELAYQLGDLQARVIVAAAPLLGEHSAQVLGEHAGVDAARFDALVDEGVVSFTPAPSRNVVAASK